MALFDTLKALGLANLEDEIARELEREEEEKKAKEEVPKEEITEIDYLYRKKYECPLCLSTIEQPTVKHAKLRIKGHDWDLRPVYKHIDYNKYDVIYCRKCGYAVVSRYYGGLARPHKEMLRNMLVPKHKPLAKVDMLIDYDNAIMRYTMAWANALCRRAKDSEKGYICLRMAWLYRGMQEEACESGKPDKDMLKLWKEKENGYLDEARKLFVAARQQEKPPIAGMDEVTFDFLLASLMRHFGEYNDAIQLLYSIITSKSATSTQKDKARNSLMEVKDLMQR